MWSVGDLTPDLQVAYYSCFFAMAAVDDRDSRAMDAVHRAVEVAPISARVRSKVRRFEKHPPTLTNSLARFSSAPAVVRFGIMMALIDVALANDIIDDAEGAALQLARKYLYVSDSRFRALRACVELGRAANDDTRAATRALQEAALSSASIPVESLHAYAPIGELRVNLRDQAKQVTEVPTTVSVTGGWVRPDAAEQFGPGTWVTHPSYGRVQVVRTDGRSLVVKTHLGDQVRILASRVAATTAPRSAVNPDTSIAVAVPQARREPIAPVRRKHVPRPYQSEAMAAVTACFKKHDRVVLALPTGSGKTFVAVKWLVDHVLANGKRVLWLAHRNELLAQAAREFQRQTDADLTRVATWWTGKGSKSASGQLVLASVAATRAFPEQPFDIMVIDEAHCLVPAS